MTRPFSLTFKKKMVERLTGKDAVSARSLSMQTGIGQQTLSRWLLEARTLTPMPPRRRDRPKGWSIDEKIHLLAQASRLSGAELTSFLEREALVL